MFIFIKNKIKKLDMFFLSRFSTSYVSFFFYAISIFYAISLFFSVDFSLINNLITNLRTEDLVFQSNGCNFEEDKYLVTNNNYNNYYSKKHSISYADSLSKNKVSNIANNNIVHGKSLVRVYYQDDSNGIQFDKESFKPYLVEKVKSFHVKESVESHIKKSVELNMKNSIEESRNIEYLIEDAKFAKAEKELREFFSLELINSLKRDLSESDYKRVVYFLIENPRVANDLLCALSSIDNSLLDQKNLSTKLLAVLSGFGGHYGLCSISDKNVDLHILTHGGSIPSEIRDLSYMDSTIKPVDELYKFIQISDKDMNNKVKDQFISTGLRWYTLDKVVIEPDNDARHIKFLNYNPALSKVLIDNPNFLTPEEILIYYLRKENLL